MMEWIVRQGLSDYQDSLLMMEARCNDVIAHKKPEAFFLVEHDHVITCGVNADMSDVLCQNDTPVVRTTRGGKVTYHGPGQRVIYPIIDLNLPNRKQDLKLYVSTLISWVESALQELGVKCHRDTENVGVWVEKSDKTIAKIASIGIRARKWVTYHGIAINIKTDLSRYNTFIPCGMLNAKTTSLQDLGIDISMHEFDEMLHTNLNRFF